MKKSPVVHFEMPYRDHQRLTDFYTKAFGWGMDKMGDDMGGYVVATTTDTDEQKMVTAPGTINGGFYPLKEDSPKSPSIVISVDDLDQAIRDVQNAGGKTDGERMEIPGIGSYIAVLDTEGNRLGVLQPLSR